MKFIKTIGGNYVNIDHVATLDISDAYHDGKPVYGKFCVTAFIPFANTDILYIGSKTECIEYIENLISDK